VKYIKYIYEKVLGIPTQFSGMPAWTDTSNLQQKSMPTVIFGAGYLCCAHIPYKYIDI